MWISTDAARSDFILTAAAIFLGVQVVSLLGRIPGYPLTGLGYVLLSLLWVTLLAIGPSFGLAKYRDEIPAAFGLAPDNRGRVIIGVVLALPLLIGHVTEVVFTGDVQAVLRSLLGRFALPNPTVGGATFTIERIVEWAAIAVIVMGSWLTGSFLSVRGKDAFRSSDADLTELLRTFGMGGVGATLILGLLVAVRDGTSALDAVTRSVVLLVIVLLADQYVPARTTTSRATLIAPAGTVMLLWVIQFGGLFGGDLLVGLYIGLAAGIVTLVASAMIEIRQGTAAAILLGTAAIYAINGLPMQVLPLTPLMPS